ncbi:MAG: zinc-dependent metalloprotease [Pseudomonadota bacterium]
MAVAWLSFGAFATGAAAQDKDKKPPTIEKKTEGFDVQEGLFPVYTDPKTGAVFIEIGAGQIGEEFVVFTYTENGVLEAGHFRGQYRDERVISLNKHYNRIEFVEENTSFYFDPENALSRAANANMSPAIVSSIGIEAVSGEGEEARYLIDARPLFLTEDLTPIKPAGGPGNGGILGGLSKSKTKFNQIRNYPKNTDVRVDYVYDGRPRGASAAVTDARAVTITVQHTFIETPDEAFEPRFDDYRVGYFTSRITDQTTPSRTPYRDLITRWRLVKKDPDAELSEPVEPIVWWIENTTPEAYRDIIKEGALAWNQSFEAAGFKDAIQVKVQPDDADWDAGDIRYNVLRWTSSPVPPFGGYGPSLAHPRTGEILAADVMLEYVYLTNRIFQDEIYGETNSPKLAENILASLDTENAAHTNHRTHACSAGRTMHQNIMFAAALGRAQGMGDDEIADLIDQELRLLILHEIGHTLGLNHNMKASSWRDPYDVHDASITDGQLTGSVMDYHAINAAPVGVEQGDWIDYRPGPYDDWAIEFGYRPDLDRKAHLYRSLEPQLTFGNDADDMRTSFWGIDPRVNVGDMSSDMVVYAEQRFDLVDYIMGDLKTKFTEEGESWQMLRDSYYALVGQKRGMARGVSRYVGGVYVERFDAGQPGSEGKKPYSPVPEAKQKAAIRLLGERIYAADAFETADDIAAFIQPQRRGYDFFGVTEDPKFRDLVLFSQIDSLQHILHPNTLGRLSNSAEYGGTYTPLEMLLDLNDEIIGGDLRGTPNVYRRNLQIVYVEALRELLLSGAYEPSAESAMLAALQDVKSRLGMFEFGMSSEQKAHRAHIRALVAGI